MAVSDVYIRLGSHSERDYLIKTASLFRGSIVGANLLEMTPGATVSLSWKIRGMGLEWIIDPITYLYGLHRDCISSSTTDKDTGETSSDLKKSFKSMCKLYGGVFKSVILDEERELRPSDFSDDGEVRNVCTSILSYQWQRMQQICEQDPQLAEVSELAYPSAVISPYFYIPGEKDQNSTLWEEVNVRMFRAFGSLASEVPKHAVLCIARSLMKDHARMTRLLDQVMDSGCEACWLWVSGMKEDRISAIELNTLVLLCKQASRSNFKLLNLHGGFLSALLQKHGMSGFSHGIGYGESKDVVPSSGGALPTVPYHYPPLHVRSAYVDIERALPELEIETAEEFHERVCDCSICKGTLKGDLRNFRKFGETTLKPKNKKETQTSDSAKRCRFHFLLARRKELDLIDAFDLPDLKRLLGHAVAVHANLPYAIHLRDRVAPLREWLELI